MLQTIETLTGKERRIQNQKRLRQISQYRRNLLHLLLYVMGLLYAVICFFIWNTDKITIFTYLGTALMQLVACEIRYLAAARVCTRTAPPQLLAEGLLLLPIDRRDIIGWHVREVAKTQLVFELLLGIMLVLVQKQPALPDLIWLVLLVLFPLFVAGINDRKLIGSLWQEQGVRKHKQIWN